MSHQIQPFKLRDYQQQSVDAVLQHFRASNESAVIVLPTGAGKSLVIAELARLAQQPILVVTHVKELVKQNQEKLQSLGIKSGVYSAGLKQKNSQTNITFASIQSLVKNLTSFKQHYSLIIVDECHRMSTGVDTKTITASDTDNNTTDNKEPAQTKSAPQYLQVIQHLKKINPEIKLLGLTATPYRLNSGWIYRYHYRGFVRDTLNTPFEHCIYELPLRYLVSKKYLTPAKVINAAIEHYDFSQIGQADLYDDKEINSLLGKYPRVTEGICQQIIEYSQTRLGVMIFAASRVHAAEIISYLPQGQAFMVDATTSHNDRDQIIADFKQQKFKYLVNISVLTTGFDAPHVDFIAILRRTESVSLYQQIIGRGLRLHPDKKECLVVDYAGNSHDLYAPEVGIKKPNPRVKQVQVNCPECDFANTFWGIKDEFGEILEHYGRRCQGLIDIENKQQCSFRFKFKQCPICMAENDIAANNCNKCHEALIDADDMLKKALKLTNHKVFRCAGMQFSKANDNSIKVTYHDEDGSEINEFFDFSSRPKMIHFQQTFKRMSGDNSSRIKTAEQAEKFQSLIQAPDFIICIKKKHYWSVIEKIFDYQGGIRKAGQL